MTPDHCSSVIHKRFSIFNICQFKLISLVIQIFQKLNDDQRIQLEDRGKTKILLYFTHVDYMESVSVWKNLQVTGASLAGANYVRGQGSTWMRLEWRSMSGDTSGACCQGKLSYPATFTPFPPNTHTHTHTHTHTPLQTSLPAPREKEGQEGRSDDEAIDRKVNLHSLRMSATK